MKEDVQTQGMRNISLVTERNFMAYEFYKTLGFKEAKNTRLMYMFLK
ncbi:hypothetical protein [Paenibacillus sediminis]|uniref:Enzyme involved in methoxymalonyl-ACP biosynthesis n=1 Tax=Paenibacillus sediminis TaxID=664909 RepID=A0ABS4H1X3_9BACL|nr:hypothetical protein [Paenibacillus sediminis]MBP1936524.1 putative enzyme involved in methoxymalonyl-ACP biosynthesis [Paenibacillus sediminis]